MRKRYHLTYTKEDIYPLFGAVGMIVIGITGVIQAGVIQEDIVCVILYSIIILIGGIWTFYVVNNILPKSLIGKQFVRLQLKEDILMDGRNSKCCPKSRNPYFLAYLYWKATKSQRCYRSSNHWRRNWK